MDVAAETAKAMARPYAGQNRTGVSYRWGLDDPGMSPEEESRADFEDTGADRLDDEPEDRTLTDELPPGFDPTWWGQGQ